VVNVSRVYPISTGNSSVYLMPPMTGNQRKISDPTVPFQRLPRPLKKLALLLPIPSCPRIRTRKYSKHYIAAAARGPVYYLEISKGRSKQQEKK
jgi:hypothetical protein